MSRATVFLVSLLLTAATGAAESNDVIPDDLRTVAEQTAFRATASYDETLSFLRELSRRMPEIRVETFGTSPAGRSLPLVVVATGDAATPSAAARSGKAIVLIQNGIHAGEIDGKDACLMILRNLARGRHRDWLDSLVLLIVPIYNVDGHERVSPFNRANQNGPVAGMGFRTTADGHDLNRDHLKLETPEARAMIGLFNRWRPHLQIDDHVTNGSDHAWVLTYTWVEQPQLSPPLHNWVERTLPGVVETTQEKGHRLGPYVWLIDGDDPSAGFRSYVGEPRYATGYYPLRNRPSILVENHAYKPYRDRVLANRDFLVALLDSVARDPESLIEAVRAAEQRTVSLGAPDAKPSTVAVAYEAEPARERIRFPVYEWSSRESIVTDSPFVDYSSGVVRETEVPWSHRPRISRSVARPRGYLVLPGWPTIERRLRDHGLRVLRVVDPLEIEVETMRVSPVPDLPSNGASYQGLTRLPVTVERGIERRHVPAGALWIPADQPDFELAVQLFEPDAPDSLVAWGLLSIVLERKEYIAPRVLERLAREMLDDSSVREAWEEALEEEAFSSNPQARWAWWYRRTQYWDETVGLLPIYRVPTMPTLTTEPWPGVIWSVEPSARSGMVR